MKAKHVIKRLYDVYKEADDTKIEFSIKVNDGPAGILYLPINPKDIKIEVAENGDKVLVVDLS